MLYFRMCYGGISNHYTISQSKTELWPYHKNLNFLKNALPYLLPQHTHKVTDDNEPWRGRGPNEQEAMERPLLRAGRYMDQGGPNTIQSWSLKSRKAFKGLILLSSKQPSNPLLHALEGRQCVTTGLAGRLWSQAFWGCILSLILLGC